MGEVVPQIKNAIELLKQIADDRGVPRNIRRVATESIEVLMNPEMTPGLKAATVISKLDEISMDPNTPLFARTKIWQIVSLLEQVKD
ncbi:MAG: UPF0147 family protein [Thermofilum sp.]|jgi:uncharacterized protein (UPF0147 family)|uniref:UPF0147 protein ENN26_00125 n=2 Tax=Thermofilum adornatum TaxID=1365176 RepID=S5ZDF7_9CREN|nr:MULTISPECIES: UPF0147 family protein [Thermofilum]AGT35028.1 hypothetical protein N186_03275 [Thermofilum adornatum]AJB42763.1 hypothetical protein TCARB_1723 [Thermofilum adornatum 1505]MCI4408273.1 UPF0147 family protein [Thermofilum sp.]